MLALLSMAELDRTERLRARRRAHRRRQVRIRRTVALGVLLALAAGIALGAKAVGGSGHETKQAKTSTLQSRESRKPALPHHVSPPVQERGVHVTMALASLPGRLQQYLFIPGLNTIELDVKDENGRVG